MLVEGGDTREPYYIVGVSLICRHSGQDIIPKNYNLYRQNHLLVLFQ